MSHRLDAQRPHPCAGLRAAVLSACLLAGPATAQPRFPEPWYRSGPETTSAVVVDFDGDGVLDAVTSNVEGGASVAGDLRLLRGKRDGSFGAPEVLASYAVSAGGLAVTDVNGDAVPDVVATLPELDQVVVHLGAGGGGVQPEISSMAGDGCRSLTLGDLNADGIADVVTANLASRTMSLLIGRGDGSFEPPTDLPLADFPSVVSGSVSPRSADLSDVDGDGDLDLLVASWPVGVNLFMGNGDGTFEPAISVLGDDRNSDSAKFADMNGDGVPDLVTIGRQDDQLRVFPGVGDGSFGPPCQYSTGPNPDHPVVADLDGDVRLDVVLSDSSSQTIQTWLGNGDGTLRPGATETPASSTTRLAVADLDGDSIPDLVRSVGLGYVGVHFGIGDGSFRSHPATPVGDWPQAMAAADLNRDGIPDAVTANDGSDDVTVVLGNGDGTFAPPVSYPLSTPPYSDVFQPTRMALGDLDGDHIDDLVLARRKVPETSVLLGVGNGSFLPASTVDLGPHPANVAIGDFDGDGIADLAAANHVYDDEGRLFVALGNGDGSFQPPLRLPLDLIPVDVVAVDVDSDGALDLVTLESFYEATLTVTRGNGDGTFQAPNSVPTLALPLSLTAADLNADAIPDLVATYLYYPEATWEEDVVVYLGRGDGSFESLPPISTGRRSSFVEPADMDGDGRIDLVVANVTDDNVSVHLGRGDGTFEPPRYYAAGDAPFRLAVTDANGDGLPDILAADANADEISVLLNGGEPPARVCDADGNGTVDRLDLREIFRSLRQRVEPDDPCDPNGDGRVTLRDLRACRGACDLPDCQPVVPACGLLGIEPLLLLAALGWRRRRRPANC
jgi:hypothetical protein